MLTSLFNFFRTEKDILELETETDKKNYIKDKLNEIVKHEWTDYELNDIIKIINEKYKKKKLTTDFFQDFIKENLLTYNNFIKNKDKIKVTLLEELRDIYTKYI